jgi:hypothetical protein
MGPNIDGMRQEVGILNILLFPNGNYERLTYPVGPIRIQSGLSPPPKGI